MAAANTTAIDTVPFVLRKDMVSKATIGINNQVSGVFITSAATILRHLGFTEPLWFQGGSVNPKCLRIVAALVMKTPLTWLLMPMVALDTMSFRSTKGTVSIAVVLAAAIGIVIALAEMGNSHSTGALQFRPV